MIDEDSALKVTKDACKKGADYCEIFAQRRRVTHVRFEDGKVEDISNGLEEGAGIRLIKGNLAAYAHTDNIDHEHIWKAASIACETLKHSKSPSVVVSLANSGISRESRLQNFESEISLEQIVENLKACNDVARSTGKDIRQVTASHEGIAEEVQIITSSGQNIAFSLERTRLVVNVVAKRNGILQTGLEAPGFLLGRSFYEKVNPCEVAGKAANRAVVMLDAKPSPAGKMLVVVNAGTGGVLFHEACGHGLEADHVRKRASIYFGKTGSKVACELVTICDDPTIPDLWGSYVFDDEGTAGRRKILIENGILRGYLYSLYEAMQEGMESNGNGRRQSFRYPPIPRMSNTFLAEGKTEPEDIISDTKYGLYAKKLGGGQVDPVTGDFVFSVSEGYIIENGEVTYPVRGATLIGNGPRTLEMIDAIGNNLCFEEGTCGKEGQGVPVTSGCPTFRIAGLTVGGTKV